MKNLMLLGMMTLIVVASCNEVQKKEAVVEGQAEIAMSNDPGDLPCFSSERIYPSTAWMWGNSWVSAYNFLYKNDKYQDSVSPGLHFPTADLKTLHDSNKNASGVLLYYILEESTGTIPSLAMKNTVNCVPDDCDGDCVLVSWYFEKENNNKNKVKGPNTTITEFISDSLFSVYQSNWHIADSLAAKGRDGYIPVDGYNYSWETLNSISTTNGILVKYGARTIDASENQDFETLIEFGKTGNIVACNVLVGWVPGQTFEQAVKLLGDDPEELDFAKPCPAYCH